jgi:hypothetical protein
MLLVISFLITLLAVLLLSRLVCVWLVKLLGFRWFNILTWPGVVVHEFSHLLGALLTFTKISGFSVVPKKIGGGQILGTVTHEAGNPVSLILISLFPFIGGSFILWCLAIILIPQAPASAPTLNISTHLTLVGLNYFIAWWSFIFSFWRVLNFTTWLTWLFLYLAFAIASHLAPSSADFKNTATGFTAVSILVVLLVYGGSFLEQSFSSKILDWCVGAINFFTPLLSYSLAILLVVALVVGVALGIKKLNHTVVWWG